MSDYAMSLSTDSSGSYGSLLDRDRSSGTSARIEITETGLEGALFRMLDKETDRKLVSQVQDTLVSLLQALAAENLTRWLVLIRDVLQSTSGKSHSGK